LGADAHVQVAVKGKGLRMKISVTLSMGTLLAGTLLIPPARGGDWPQWRGPGRDAKAAGFVAPKTWPAELTQKWKVTVGRGDATPAWVGDRIYVFVNDAGGDITLCLDAQDGHELWRDRYDAPAATEPMGQHPGPRSSPAVADGKIVLYGARGTLSCLDLAPHKLLWRKNDFPGAWPRFFTSASPLIADQRVIAQLGGERQGGVVAYDLTSGAQKWKWAADGTAYASPALLTVGGTHMVAAMTAQKIVGLDLADGKLLWELPFAAQEHAYNAATPIVDGSTLIYTGAGRGTRAVKIEKTDSGYAAKELWSNPASSVQFNTPVIKDGRLYGITQKGELFCLALQDGHTLWTAPLGGRGFGSIVDAGPVLFALTPQGELIAFASSATEFKKLASYKVGADTYAYPVLTADGLCIKDKDALTRWAF